MAQGIFQNRTADSAELGHSAGGGITGSVTLGRQRLQTVIVAANTAVLHQPLAAAGGAGYLAALVPLVAQSLGVVGNIAVIAAGAGIGGVPTLQAGRLGDSGNMIVTDRIGVVALVAELAVSTDISGIAHGGAGCASNIGLEIVLQRLLNDGTAVGAGLRIGAGGILTGSVAGGGNGFQLALVAADTAVLGHALTGAGGFCDSGAFIPVVAQGSSIVSDKGTAAAIALMEGTATGHTSGRQSVGNILVGQRGSDVGDMAVAADAALIHGIAGAGAGSRNGIGVVVMFTLGGRRSLDLTAAGADLHGLTIGFAGGFTDYDALPSMAQSVHIVTLLNLAAVGAEITVITQGKAGGIGAVQQDEAVVIAAAGITAALAAAGIIHAPAIGVAAAAGTIVLGIIGNSGFIVQPDIGNAILGHVNTLVGVGDRVIDGVLALFGKVGGRGQSAAIRAVAIADLRGNTGFGEVGHGQRVRLTVHYTVVVSNNTLGSYILMVDIVAEGAALHQGKTTIGWLGQNLIVQHMALQNAGFLLVSAKAEAAVGAGLSGLGVIGAVGIFVGHDFIQSFGELGSTVIQPIDILGVGIAGHAHVAVDGAAGFADGLCPVVAGIVGVHAGSAVQNSAGANAVQQRAIRVFHIAQHSGLAITSVLGNTEHGEGSCLPALCAGKGFMGNGGVGVQLIGAVHGRQPMLGGIVVVVLLRGEGRGGEQGQDHHKGQKQRNRTSAMLFGLGTH